MIMLIACIDLLRDWLLVGTGASKGRAKGVVEGGGAKDGPGGAEAKVGPGGAERLRIEKQLLGKEIKSMLN